MKVQTIHFVLLCAAGLIVGAGCKDDEKCTKARNAAASSWKAITTTAGTNKVAPTIGLDELPPDKKAPHVEAWGTIEKQADMIASSFLYEKITWNTADPALAKANLTFDAYFAKDKFKSFQAQLKDGNDSFKAASDACRD